MKKAILLSVIFPFFTGLEAQSSAPTDAGKGWGINSYYYYGNQAEWLALMAGGKKVKAIETSSSKSEKNNQFLAMNERGQVTERKEYHFVRVECFWRNSFFHEKLEYDNDLVSRVDFYDRKGRITEQALYEYFDRRKLKHSVFKRKGKTKLENKAAFNADSNITSFVSYKFKKGKPLQNVRYEYDYYPDKQSKETRMYDSRNRLKHLWKYDCNPKGEIKKEKETQICKNTGMDNRGRQVEIVFNTNPKGHKTKTVHTYYVSGGKKVQVQLENYIIEKGAERKLNEIHFADSLEKYYSYTYYDKKGRMTYQTRMEYSVYSSKEEIRLLYTSNTYSRNKLVLKVEEKFNGKGMPLSSTITNSKGRITGRTEYNYQGDTQYSISHYNKKEKLLDTFTTRIQYY